MGEPIPIRLCFSSALADAYRLSAAQYDRSGRMHQDRFSITPEYGHTDPLAEHFRSGVLVGPGGGLRGEPILGVEPVCIAAFLNEWVRFDAAGRYEVLARSFRIQRQVEGAEEPRTEWVDVASTPLTIEIAPFSPKWAEKELEAIIHGSSGAGSNAPNSTIRLRFLGTPNALDKLARRISNPEESVLNCAFGLIESRYRSEARESLEKVLADPAEAVSPELVRVLAFLRVRDSFKTLAPPMEHIGRLSRVEFATLERRMAMYLDRHKQEVIAVSHELAAVLPSKKSMVRAQCLEALQDLNPELALAANGANVARESDTPAPVVPPFGATSSHPPSPEHPHFRELVLKDLAQAMPRYPLTTLRSLPDQTLPGYELHFARNVQASPGIFGPLLARYGSASALPKLRSEWETSNRSWDCETRAPFLAYFLKADPATGIEIFRKAMADRKDNGCYRFFPDRVFDLYPGESIEIVMLELLEDADPEVSELAARWVEQNGSAKALPILWRVLESWHSKWAGNVQALVGNPIVQPSYTNYEFRKGGALVGAIFRAQSWVLEDAGRTRLHAMCVESRCREMLATNPGQKFPIRLSIGTAGYRPRYEVGQYSPHSTERLSQKLAQYPRGTIFGWCGDRDHKSNEPTNDSRDRDRWFAEASTIARGHGHSLARNPPRGTCLWVDE
ncbi:MAG: hypothetical protein KIT83_19815 [Bryobacterales bacterium]|nr:hypothetical protein [Bryobacterales bacterium]